MSHFLACVEMLWSYVWISLIIMHIIVCCPSHIWAWILSCFVAQKQVQTGSFQFFSCHAHSGWVAGFALWLWSLFFHNVWFLCWDVFSLLLTPQGHMCISITHAVIMDLCFLPLQNISGEMFTPCLVDLCKALWEVMKSYYCTMRWHETHKQDVDTSEGEWVKVMRSSWFLSHFALRVGSCFQVSLYPRVPWWKAP